jgi:hypothetical protein
MDRQSIMDKVNQIKSELLTLAKQIRELPPNPNVEQLSHNCISLKSSELFKHDKWSPDYYIFYNQYETIAELLTEFPIQSALQMLDRLIEKGKITVRGNLITFHPMVIQNLKTIIK